MDNSDDNSNNTGRIVFKLFWRHVFPAVLAMLISGIYVIIDGIFIGQIIGEKGLAAIGVAYPLMTFFTGVGLLVGIGGGAIISLQARSW